MEHAQRVVSKEELVEISKVLILILMEHAQRAISNNQEVSLIFSLNPYFNGICSKRRQILSMVLTSVVS